MYNGAITLRMLRVKYGNAGGGSDLHRQIRAVDQHGNTIINIIVFTIVIANKFHYSDQLLDALVNQEHFLSLKLASLEAMLVLKGRCLGIDSRNHISTCSLKPFLHTSLLDMVRYMTIFDKM